MGFYTQSPVNEKLPSASFIGEEQTPRLSPAPPLSPKPVGPSPNRALQNFRPESPGSAIPAVPTLNTGGASFPIRTRLGNVSGRASVTAWPGRAAHARHRRGCRRRETEQPRRLSRCRGLFPSRPEPVFHDVCHSKYGQRSICAAWFRQRDREKKDTRVDSDARRLSECLGSEWEQASYCPAANTAHSKPPEMARSRLSVSTWRLMRQRLAPSEARTAIA